MPKTPSRIITLQAIAEAVETGDANQILAAAHAGLALHPGSLPVMEAYISALDRLGRCDEALLLAVEASHRRIGRMGAARETRPLRELAAGDRIFLSGYFYSGSGAVLDYLKDFEGTAKWSPAGEMRLIKFPGGVADMARRFRLQGALAAQDVLDFYLHVIGAKATSGPAGHYDKWAVVNRNSAKLLTSPEATGYVIRCLECFNWLARLSVGGVLTAPRLARGFRRSMAAVLDAAATDMGADCLLIDQAVTAWRLPLSKFTPPSTYVIVHRDPRDQFVDASVALAAPGRTSLSPQTFAEQYRTRRLAAEKTMTMMKDKLGHRVISLSFEDFVIDHEASTRDLLAALGFEQRRRPKPRYDVGASRRNVGKHRALISEDDAAIIAAALPEYLSPHVG